MTTKVVRGVVPLLLAVLPGTGFSQVAHDEPAKAVHISGRVTDVKGRPLGGAMLSLVPLDPGDTAPPVTAIAKYDGLVVFAGAPKRYKLSVPGGEFKIVPATLNIDARDIEVGDIIVQPDVRNDLKLEQIIVDPGVLKNRSSSLGPILSPPTIGLEGWRQPIVPFTSACNVHFDRYRTVEAFLGGKVKTIRVVRFAGSSEPKPAEIQSRIMEVWLGVFRDASCGITWSEGVFWNLEASVEYEDGKRGAILIDRWIHLQVLDREGRLWFIRLWPGV
jgi:hypothetical protein